MPKDHIDPEAPAAETGGFCVGIIHHFSRQHFSAARYFRDQATTMEGAISERPPGAEQLAQHRAYVTGTIMSAVAGLESSINELFMCAARKDATSLPYHDAKTMALLAALWESTEAAPTLAKYQVALTASGSARFDPGARPYQDTDLVIRLRNTLVHYKPELDLEPRTHAKLSKQLTAKFVENRFAQNGSLWFPHRCLGAGCAEWAVATTEAFLVEFCRQINVPSRLPQ